MIAAAIKLVTIAMFKHPFYSFAGLKYQQIGGGPISLRGTCTIARLVISHASILRKTLRCVSVSE